jgi:peptide/nickel transport system permease protein
MAPKGSGRLSEWALSRLIVGRLLIVVPVVLGVSLLAFAVLELMPGTPAQVLLGPEATEEQIAALEWQLKLDRPAVARYWEWLSNALKGDLGRSVASGQPVARMLAERLPVTLELVTLALLLSISLAVGLALLAVRRPNGVMDRACAVVSIIGLSVPNYVLALALVLLLAVNARLFPSIGFVPLGESISGNLASMTLPAIALGFPFCGFYTRLLRGDLLEQMRGQDYVLTAMAKGLGPWRVLLGHVFPNSVFGLATVVGMNAGALIGGAVIIEQIFALPGMGHLLLQAINVRDFVTVQGVVLVTALATVLVNLGVDLFYVTLDPRVRYGVRF